MQELVSDLRSLFSRPSPAFFRLSGHLPAMPKSLATPLLAWANRLRYPTLFKLTAGLLLVDVLLPDPLPFVDELAFGLATLALAQWRSRKAPLDARDARS